MTNPGIDQETTALLLKGANIPRRYQEPVTFNPREHAGWADAFDKLAHKVSVCGGAGIVIILCGARGTGKTRMAAELIYHAIREWRFLCRYEVFQDYLDRLPRPNSPMGCSEHDETYLIPRLLVIDEIAKAGDSAWAESRLFHLVNSRYNDLKHTVLITAAGPDQLNDILSPSVADRIHEGGAVIHLDWPSFRSNHQ